MAKRTVAERFWAKVDRNGPVPEYAPHLGPCWTWTGNTTRGYGNFWLGHVNGKAHRFSYELAFGAIPDGLQIDHLCRVRFCVNPSHLEAVTQRENILRSPECPASVNAHKTHCKRGHEFTPANTQAVKTLSGWGRRCRTCDALRAWE